MQGEEFFQTMQNEHDLDKVAGEKGKKKKHVTFTLKFP